DLGSWKLSEVIAQYSRRTPVDGNLNVWPSVVHHRRPSKAIVTKGRFFGNSEFLTLYSRKAGLGYIGTNKEGRTRRKAQSQRLTKPDLYCHFISGGIISPDQIAMIEVGPNGYNQDLINKIHFNDNATLVCDDANKSSGQDEGESLEADALVELERLIKQEEPKFQSMVEDLKVINRGGKEEEKEIWVGKQMPSDLKQKLVELLKEYADVFAWSYRDMLGLDNNIVEHKLPLHPNVVPVRQQLRRMKPKVILKIKEEVEKQWNAEILAVAEYPQWVANIVSVPKKDGKIRMCVDYRDLNRASSKDNFLLPHIDMLVDNTA
ncbi:hypothetical protein CR513_52931, partial [Mucuna pruriens]